MTAFVAAQVKTSGKSVHLGFFATAEEAALSVARDAAVNGPPALSASAAQKARSTAMMAAALASGTVHIKRKPPRQVPLATKRAKKAAGASQEEEVVTVVLDAVAVDSVVVG